MTDRRWYECYGFPVRADVDSEAVPVLDAFFGPAVTAPGIARYAGLPTVLLTVEVGDSGAPSAEPPHNPSVIKADVITIDTGASRASIDPPAWTAAITLARKDLEDPIVWGRWLLERIFLYLVLRSPRHYPMHAGGLRSAGRTALVCGPTGMGKSTFTAWAMRRGATLLGEDIMVRHLDDEPRLFWGYPYAIYLTPQQLDGHPYLADAPRAEVDGGAKYRVTVPAVASGHTGARAEVDAVVVLARGEGDLRPVSYGDVVEGWRDDYAAGKEDPSEVEAVEADLHRCLADRPIWVLAASPDLDAAYDLVQRNAFGESHDGS